MFKNYLKTSVNALLKRKLYSAINIFGLSIGLTACLLILLYVNNETSYDQHWDDAERLYRVNTTYLDNGRSAWSSLYLKEALGNSFPDEIEASTRVRSVPQEYRIGEVIYQNQIALVDPDFSEMFQLEIVDGSIESTLSDPRSIALSTQYAQRFFGDTDILGETLTLTSFGESRDYLVSAIFNPPAANTVLNLPAIAVFDEAIQPVFYFSWTSTTTETYVKLNSPESVVDIHSRLPAFVERFVDVSAANPGPDVSPSDIYVLDVQNIQDIYLNSEFDGMRAGGNPVTVLAFSAIAALVLLIGCINFTVLGTARATERAKEVGLRKVVGAQQRQLIIQFLAESALLVLPAMVFALVLVETLLPVFESLVGKELLMPRLDLKMLIYVAGLLLTVIVIGGIYPAFVLSHFRPATSLHGHHLSISGGTFHLRTALVVFQFGISIALIIATSVIYMQMQFVQNRDPGFDGENLLIIDNLFIRPEVNARKSALKQEIKALPGVTSAVFSGHKPMLEGDFASIRLSYAVAGNSVSDQQIATMVIDYGWFDTYGIDRLSGRDFSEDIDQALPLLAPGSDLPAIGKVVINRSAVTAMGFSGIENAIGELISVMIGPVSQDLEIIAVVEDTQFTSLRTAPRAETYILSPDTGNVLTVGYTGETDRLLENIEDTWISVMEDAALNMEFVDQSMAGEFDREETEAQFLVSFSLLAIVIACLGLYGSASFTVDRRTKEIGIRKVMGAEVREIVTLLMWQFSKPVLIANIIAWPAALWAMLTWLQRFPYQIDTLLLIPLCVLAGFIALSIAWLTVAGNTVKVATTNPVYALRYE